MYFTTMINSSGCTPNELKDITYAMVNAPETIVKRFYQRKNQNSREMGRELRRMWIDGLHGYLLRLNHMDSLVFFMGLSVVFKELQDSPWMYATKMLAQVVLPTINAYRNGEMTEAHPLHQYFQDGTLTPFVTNLRGLA